MMDSLALAFQNYSDTKLGHHKSGPQAGWIGLTFIFKLVRILSWATSKAVPRLFWIAWLWHSRIMRIPSWATFKSEPQTGRMGWSFASQNYVDTKLGNLKIWPPSTMGGCEFCIQELCRYQAGQPQNQIPKLNGQDSKTYADIKLGNLKIRPGQASPRPGLAWPGLDRLCLT